VTWILVALIVYVWFRPPAWVTDENRPAPPVRATLLDGRQVSLADLRGKVVLVNFWATWCPYCRHEMPSMESFYRDYRSRGFEILALSIDDDPATVRSFMAQEGYSFPVAMSNGAGQLFGGVTKVPTSYVIDKRGHVRKVVSGQVHYGRMKDLVEPLLKE
jgi:peroxiredoxin